jgi:4-hydroxy-3-polyprenylbenzoate decarboxylase
MQRSLPAFPDLRAFLGWVESRGEPLRIAEPLPHRMAAVQIAALRAGGPVLRFDAPLREEGRRAAMRVVANSFGTRERVAA